MYFLKRKKCFQFDNLTHLSLSRPNDDAFPKTRERESARIGRDRLVVDAKIDGWSRHSSSSLASVFDSEDICVCIPRLYNWEKLSKREKNPKKGGVFRGAFGSSSN